MKQQNIKNIIKSRQGFSLVEIMIVLVIIGFIMTLVGTNLMDRFQRSKVDNTKIQMHLLGDALDTFHLDCGRYPTSDQTLKALIEKPQDLKCDRYSPAGYTKNKKVPQDGWSNDFIYESDGRAYEIISLGRDGAESGEGYDADLSTKDF